MIRADGRQGNKPSEKARVLCYSGYKGEETPRVILVDDKEIKVEKILSRKRISDTKTGRVREVFTGKTSRGFVRMEKGDNGSWTVVFL